MWEICFEDKNETVVNKMEFDNYRKARECFDALVLKDFEKAVLIRKDGTFLDLKEKTVDTE